MRVYQLHGAAINSMVMHSGFCVTASDDKQLRVWPIGFADYLLEVRELLVLCSCIYVLSLCLL